MIVFNYIQKRFNELKQQASDIFKQEVFQMTKQLIGKTAIVTGASSGIGTAIAKELVQAGANVVLAARNEEKLTEIADAIIQKE